MEKLRIGIVGLNFGRHILRELTSGSGSRYFELAAVCDIRQDAAKEMAAQYGVKPYFDLDALLADASIPVVGLYTGPGGRANLLRKIIRAGRDVMTTKPFELDPDAALAVLNEARQLGRVIHLNSPSPLLSPDLQQIRTWIDAYGLGRPIACRADVWVRYNEKADGRWYDDPAQCPVAPIFRLGIYLINDLVRFFGPADRVQVLHSRIFTGRPTPDNAQLGILFKNGGLANVFASFCIDDKQYYRNSLTMNFENGTVYRNSGPVERTPGELPSQMAVAARTGPETNRVETAVVEGHSGAYQWDALHRAVRGEKLEGEVTPEEVAAGLKIIRAMARSERTGRTENVDA